MLLVHKRLLGGYLACALAVGIADDAAGQTRVLLSTGDTPPDGAGAFVAFGDDLTLNDDGQVAFRGRIQNVPDRDGIFRIEPDGGVVQLVRTLGPAPDGNGQFDFLQYPAMNPSGRVAFGADLRDTLAGDLDDTGLFLADGASLVQVARAGQAAPDGNGAFAAFPYDAPILNDAGQVAFNAQLTATAGGTDDNDGVFRADPAGPLVQIARKGQLVPGGGAYFDTIPYGLVGINNPGQVAFRADLTDTPGGTDAGTGIYLGDGTDLVQIARTGQGSPDGNGVFTQFRSVFSPAVNDAGQVAFRADLAGTQNGSRDDQGVYVGDSAGGLRQVLRADQPAPDGKGFFDSFGLPALNNAGQVVVFVGHRTPPYTDFSDAWGLYRADGLSTPLQIVRGGQPTPDGDGVFDTFVNPALNDRGQAAFEAILNDTPGGDTDQRGIYWFDESLGLREVVRWGDAMLGSTVTWLHFSNSQGINASERAGLNNRGEVAYSFGLADGRWGIALWTPPTALPGDTDGDGDIDDVDLGTLFANYTGPVGESGGKRASDGDTDRDGDVDDADLGAAFAGYTGSLNTATAPEPSSIAALGAAGIILTGRRRRGFTV
jgi:hypothetical protein